MAQLQTNDQAAQRRYERKRDQHGRLWGMNIELKSGHPVGKVEFIAHLAHKQYNPKPEFVLPPILPPQRFLRVIDGDPYRIDIDYEEWLAEARRATAEYRRSIMEEGLRLHGSAYDSSKPPTQEILSIVGTPPTAPEVIIACRQGNSWIIGKSKKPDSRLEKYLVRHSRYEEPDYSTADFSDEKQPAGAGAPK